MKPLKSRKLEGIWRKSVKRLTFGIVKKIAVIVLLAGLNWSGLAAIGQTAGYFNDNENSSDNVLGAATLDFSLSSGADFSPNVAPTQSASRNIVITKDGSLGFQYTVQATNISGTLCDYLNLEANLDGNGVEYPAGLISGFNYNAGEFSAPEDWQFTATLIGSDLSLQGQICTFDFVFDGTQASGGGFSDTETIQNTVRASYWDPPVVLNEFLPNAGDYPEFVEIYNQTGSDIDLDGFYIKANDNTIPINTTTTYDYSGGSTIIPANGWLVVTAGGDLIDDTSGTIALYNGNDVVVDSYDYGTPDHNVNNTPGGTNNLAGYWPFDGDTQDLSGNGNDGTNNGAASVSSGKINQALSFDGTNDYVEIPHSSPVNISGSEITLETWIKANALPSIGERLVILNKDNAYALQVADSGKVRVWLGPLTTYIQTDAPEILADSWYHLVGVYNGSSVKIYVNGNLKKEVAKSGNQATSASSIIIGTKPPVGYFNGIIDEIKIYSRVLDAGEVLAHYNAVGSPEGAVPVDKSYARIPDGMGAWVDPMPTPGRPNKLVKTSEDISAEIAVEKTASVSFSETLGLAASAITEFVLGEEEVVASASAETTVDVPDLAPVASGSVEPLVEPLPSPEASPESSPEPSADSASSPQADSASGSAGSPSTDSPQATPEPTVTPTPSTGSPQAGSGQATDSPQPQTGDGNLIQTVTEPAIPVEPVTPSADSGQAVEPPADPPAPEPAPAPAPEIPAAPVDSTSSPQAE